jgi:hypothetical protein
MQHSVRLKTIVQRENRKKMEEQAIVIRAHMVTQKSTNDLEF